MPGPRHELKRHLQKRRNLLILVPRRGLEPPRCYPLVPETSASTNSATWASGGRRNVRKGSGTVNAFVTWHSSRAASCRELLGWSVIIATCIPAPGAPDAATQQGSGAYHLIRKSKSKSGAKSPSGPAGGARQFGQRRERGGKAGGSRAGGARGGGHPAASGELIEAEGILSAHRDGYGFVRTEALTDSVFLPPREMQGLMHGDRLRVEVRGDGQGRYIGRVLSIQTRGVQAFLATIEAGHGCLMVRAVDSRVAIVCRVVENAVGARAGDWVIARVTRYPEQGQQGEANVQRRLDPERPVEMATEAAIARYGLPLEFSNEVLREAQGWGHTVDAAEAARRVDLRALPLVTIDGEDAKDFDDAVFAEQRPEGGYRLIVAIADVSHYVRPGSALDSEAVARGTSVYFPTRVLPMLPTALSNHLCSLEPNVDRLCMVADMQLSVRGEL